MNEWMDEYGWRDEERWRKNTSNEDEQREKSIIANKPQLTGDAD